MLIHELAERSGLHIVTIRRLEKSGVVTARRDKNGWRHFDERDVEILRKLYAKDPESRMMTTAAAT